MVLHCGLGGGLKLTQNGIEVTVLTLDSALGRAVFAHHVGDEIELGGKTGEILAVA